MPKTAAASAVAIESLVALGLTALEAEVYAFLLSESPATGYRVAQALGKPFGSVYKSIESLQSKGAILTAEEGDNQLVRAVQVRELLEQLTQKFRTQRRAALCALSGKPEQAVDDRVYEVHTAQQFFSRVRRSLRSARQFVIASCTPYPLNQLAEDFVRTAARGVSVGVKIFEPVVLAGVRTVLDPRGSAAVESGPGQWSFFSIDGRVIASALFTQNGEKLHQGYWSANALLGWQFYTGLSSDFMLAEIRNTLRSGAAASDVATCIDSFAAFENSRSLGKRSLRVRFRRAGRKRRSNGG